jgi:ADP-ribose pyrophosphatase
MAVDELVIERDERVGTGGSLAIRRLRVHNRRADGTRSASYTCDFIDRPHGQDAVVIALWHRADDGRIHVLVRDGRRPAVSLGRSSELAPLPDRRRDGWLTELPAGIVEPSDRGLTGLLARAVAEAAEEAGFAVAPEAFTLLGAGSYPSPGSVPEKYFFVAAEVDPARQGPLSGDGSPMEEGATTRWLELDAAIAACVAGELEDAKTELGLRRLRDALTTRST